MGSLQTVLTPWKKMRVGAGAGAPLLTGSSLSHFLDTGALGSGIADSSSTLAYLFIRDIRSFISIGARLVKDRYRSVSQDNPTRNVVVAEGSLHPFV